MNSIINLKKLVLILICVFTLSLGLTGNAYAMENNSQSSENTNITKIDEITNELQITEKEAENLDKNLNSAVKQLPEVTAGETVTIPVSENLILEAETNSDSPTNTRATYNHTITSTLKLKNILGKTVVKLNSVGVFRTNGKKSTPTDAYGTYSALVWNVSTKKSVKGKAAYNTHVRNSFSGKFNIGISPVNMTVQSFSYVCTIHCNAAGKYSASWR